MPNSYFQFKQFRIDQDRCAMPVSTEACILGAYVKSHFPNSILDIGTGTGLISLMLAQRLDGQIDMVEIDPDAYIQAKENADKSPWYNRLSVHNEDIFEFAKRGKSYDLIVSNPPFFTASKKSGNEKKDLAKHDSGQFDKVRFAEILPDLLTAVGEAFVLYPEREAEEFSKLITKQNLHADPALVIRNQPMGPIFRVILRIGKSENESRPEELNIRIGNEYSPEFKALLSPYYLYL